MCTILCTGPDICHAVGIVSWFQSSPRIENILKYLESRRDCVLKYSEPVGTSWVHEWRLSVRPRWLCFHIWLCLHAGWRSSQLAQCKAESYGRLDDWGGVCCCLRGLERDSFGIGDFFSSMGWFQLLRPPLMLSTVRWFKARAPEITPRWDMWTQSITYSSVPKW